MQVAVATRLFGIVIGLTWEWGVVCLLRYSTISVCLGFVGPLPHFCVADFKALPFQGDCRVVQ